MFLNEKKKTTNRYKNIMYIITNGVKFVRVDYLFIFCSSSSSSSNTCGATETII